MIVEVTQEDIDKGKKCEATACPVALALFRATGAVWSVGINSMVCLSNYKNYNKTISTPRSAKRWMRDYDMGLSTQPFKFEI